MTKKYDIVVVDDHALFRKGLTAALSSADIADHIHEAANGADFLEILNSCRPDIVMMDISMPVMDGIEATRHALEKFPELKILALSMYRDRAHYQDMVDAGVMGFLSKDERLEEIIRAIDLVSHGKRFVSRSLQAHLPDPASPDDEYAS